MQRSASQKTDGRFKDYEPKTPFQKWLKPILDRNASEGIAPANYQDIHRAIIRRGKADYESTYVYRIVRGDPAVNKNAARPGYELALEIGEIVGDPIGALRAAEYEIPDDPNKIHLRMQLPDGQQADTFLPKNLSAADLQRIKAAISEAFGQSVLVSVTSDGSDDGSDRTS